MATGSEGAASTLQVYTLARVGVNLVDDPLVLVDGALTLGQNAQTSPEGSDGGLLKRAGMSKINATAAPASLLAILSLPFLDPE
jgi:hypothetical protein